MAVANEDWVARTAAEVIAEGDRRHPGDTPVCASGISPSGSVHLGNLRELFTPHLVADEVRRSGHPCQHILSWDDYDRFRRVPAGFPDSFAEHVGRPLTSVPDPAGDCHESWAEHFKGPLRESLALLGIRVREISQTHMYASGAYTEQIILAMRRRADISAILRRYQTKGSGADDEARTDYFPFRPYCSACGRDDTTVTAFEDDTAEITYICGCGAAIGPVTIGQVQGKLVWKVDWPMRWAYERVTFEPAGADHASPGSSFTVGRHLVEEIFGGQMPLHFGYSFVGVQGAARMSGSVGGAPTPKDALEIFEVPLIRWLYARRRPEQSITMAFDTEVGRIYDEWDALTRKVSEGTAEPGARVIYARASSTADGELPQTPRPMPFRALASISDITAGDEEQELRILRDLTPQAPVNSLDEVRPRLDCARAWALGYAPDQARTTVRDQPDHQLLASLTEQDQHGLKLFLDQMAGHWSLDGLTTQLYGIPKLIRGLQVDMPPTAELKAAQRAWFVLLYRLLIGKETGPRLPTLLLALGEDRVRTLLGA